MSLLELFVKVDDYCMAHKVSWEKVAIQSGGKRRHRAGRLYMSEVMTLLIHFHQSHYRHFKAYYTEYVQVLSRSEDELPKTIRIENPQHRCSRAKPPSLSGQAG